MEKNILQGLFPSCDQMAMRQRRNGQREGMVLAVRMGKVPEPGSGIVSCQRIEKAKSESLLEPPKRNVVIEMQDLCDL